MRIRALAAVLVLASVLLVPTARAAERTAAAVPGTFVTSLVVANPGTVAASVQMLFFNASGQQAIPPYGFTVPAGASVLTYVPNIGGLPDGRYSVELVSNYYVTLLTNLRATDTLASTAYSGIPGGTVAGDRATTLYVPSTYASTNGYSTSLVVFNGGHNVPANVTITYRDSAGAVVTTETRTIPAFASSIFDQAATPNLGSGFRSAVITSDQTVSAVSLVANQALGRLASVRGVVPRGPNVYLPVAYNGYAGYSTTLTIQNADTVATTPQIFYVDALSGQVVGNQRATNPLQPGASIIAEQFDTPNRPAVPPPGFNGSALVGSIEDKNLVAKGEILSNTANYEQYNAVPTSLASSRVTCMSVLKNYHGYNTSVSIQNVDSAATTLTLSYVDGSGRVLSTQTSPSVASGASFFSYTPSVQELPDGFNGGLVVRSSGQRIIAVVNELLGTGGEPGDQLFTYGCDNVDQPAAGSYFAYAPIVLKNAPVS